MDAIELHDNDFIGWTERQARLLRSLPAGALGLDTTNLAEEIEDLGRSEIREVSSLLLQLLTHLIKLAAAPEARSARHWFDEVVAFQGRAVLACSPGIRQRIDLEKIWHLSQNAAQRSLSEHEGGPTATSRACPVGLAELLDLDFDPQRVIRMIAAALHL